MADSHLRAGSFLIIVAGISALLAGMSVVFLVRNRSDAEESVAFEREAQARIMLVAACSYIQEASRIGWDAQTNTSSVHLETYGWIDVRDGALGPKPYAEDPSGPAAGSAIRSTPSALAPISNPDAHEKANRDLAGDAPPGSARRFPMVGAAARFPMYVMRRPPYAIQNRASYNPIDQDAASPDYLASYLRYPDPQPVTGNGWRKDPGDPAGSVSAARFAEWESGDQAPRQTSVGMSWFRLLREPDGSTFLVTCGAGATMGFRLQDWNAIDAVSGRPVMTAQDKAVFGDDFDTFRDLDASEVRLWYRVEWSPAIMAIDNHLIWHHGGGFDHYEQFPLDVSVRTSDPWGQLVHHNLGGTIALIQRLRQEPANW